MEGRQQARTVAIGEHTSVTSIELHFVFALTQVTALTADEETAWGVIRGISEPLGHEPSGYGSTDHETRRP